MADAPGPRRGLFKAVAALGLGATALSGGYAWLRARDAATWRDALALNRAPPGAEEQPMLGLVRHAALAANSHNTQPWHFVLGAGTIEIRPDTARRTPAVDPDDHHLHASLGCALENLLQAAPAFGLQGEGDFPEAGPARVRLVRGSAQAGPLFQAIARRQSTRAPFDGTPVVPADLDALHRAGRGAGVEMVLITEATARERLTEMVVEGNAVQMRDAAFVAELLGWIRFSHAEALAHRDGLFAAASGNPVVPGPIGRALFARVFTIAGETDKYVRHLRSSAGLAVFVAARNDPAGWLQAGRCAQRFCLQATALGIRTAWVNQPVEVPALRRALAGELGIGTQRPNLVLRFGRGPELPPSLRRPPAAIILTAARNDGTRAA